MNSEFSPLSRKPIPVELDAVNANRVLQRAGLIEGFGAAALKGHDANTLGTDFAGESANPNIITEVPRHLMPTAKETGEQTKPDLITELPFDVASRPDLRVVPDLIEMPDHLKPQQ